MDESAFIQRLERELGEGLDAVPLAALRSDRALYRALSPPRLRPRARLSVLGGAMALALLGGLGSAAAGWSGPGAASSEVFRAVGFLRGVESSALHPQTPEPVSSPSPAPGGGPSSAASTPQVSGSISVPARQSPRTSEATTAAPVDAPTPTQAGSQGQSQQGGSPDAGESSTPAPTGTSGASAGAAPSSPPGASDSSSSPLPSGDGSATQLEVGAGGNS